MDSSLDIGTANAEDLNPVEQSFLSQQLWWERFHQNNRTASALLSSTSAGLNNQGVSTATTDVMNQLCRVCGEPAAGFHFGAFTCEGCKSFFGRTYNNLSSISECKNGGQCVINKKNRTSCKACRLRKCLVVGMSKSGSRYGRRSNWFKIHCLLQEQTNNNNNNTLQSIQQSSMNHSGPSLMDSKHVKSENWSNGLQIHSLKKSPESPPQQQIPPTSRPTMLPELRNLQNYGSENAVALSAAAAAFWSSRASSLMPHLPSPDLSSLTSSTVPLSPFLASPFTGRNFLFPYNMTPATPNRPTIAERLSTPATTASPPSSSASSCCSSPGVKESKVPRMFREECLTGLALLQTLGPVQEQPMDLSVSGALVTNKRDSARVSESETDEEEDDDDVRVKSEKSGSKVGHGVGSGAGDSDSGCKMEHPGKPSTPLDLTTKL